MRREYLRGLSVFLASLFFSALPAQKLQISDVKVVDSFTRARLNSTEDGNGVRILIYDKDSTLLADDLLYFGNGATKYLVATVTLPLRREYVFKVEREGYEPATHVLRIPQKELERTSAGDYLWNDVCEIPLKRRPREQNLSEATVRASRLLMVMKGDTIEYDARAVQLSAGSMLGDLVRALPGAELSNDGRIYVNGKFVDRLLLNGRDFFKGDPLVALSNLPYYIIDKIKVFPHKANVAMDVRLRREYAQGWIANFEAAGGVQTRGGSQGVYSGRVFAMRYTDHSSLAVYGAVNNLSKNFSPAHQGQWREMTSLMGGTGDVQSAGIDFSVDGKRTGLNFHTSLTGEHTLADRVQKTSATDFYASGDLFRRRRRLEHVGEYGLKWEATLAQKRKAYRFELNPSLSYAKTDARRRDLGATFSGDPLDAERTASLDSLFGPVGSPRLERLLSYKSRSLWSDRSTDLRVRAALEGGVRLPWGEWLDLSADADYRDRCRDVVEVAQMTSRHAGDYNENRASRRPEDTFASWAKAVYRLLSLEGRRASFRADLSYRFSARRGHTDYDSRRNADDYGDLLPSMDTGLEWTPDPAVSFVRRLHTDSHEAGLYAEASLSGLKSGMARLRLRLPLASGRRHFVERRPQSGEQRIVRRDVTFSPEARLSFMNGALETSYSLVHRLPEMNDLVDLEVSGSSLSRWKGNPSLRPARTHNLGLGYRRRWKRRGLDSRFNLEHHILDRRLTTAQSYDPATNVTTRQPRNISGNWWSAASARLSRHLDKARRLFLETTTDYRLAHSVDYASYASDLSPGRQTVVNHVVGEKLGVKYNRNPYRLGATLSARWTRATSASAHFETLSYADIECGLTLAAPLVWGFDFDTDLSLTLRRGYRDRSMNDTQWVWNAALSRRLGRRGQWVARAVGFDLLHQLSDVLRRLDAQGHSEVWMNRVNSYVMLSLTYQLEVKPRK